MLYIHTHWLTDRGRLTLCSVEAVLPGCRRPLQSVPPLCTWLRGSIRCELHPCSNACNRSHLPGFVMFGTLRSFLPWLRLLNRYAHGARHGRISDANLPMHASCSPAKLLSPHLGLGLFTMSRSQFLSQNSPRTAKGSFYGRKRRIVSVTRLAMRPTSPGCDTYHIFCLRFLVNVAQAATFAPVFTRLPFRSTPGIFSVFRMRKAGGGSLPIDPRLHVRRPGRLGARVSSGG